jgi:hypothetical protein
VTPAEVRYYFDADVLGLAHTIVKVRSDVTFPGDPGGTVHRRTRPPCPITDTSTEDAVWIPAVTAEGWIIVTRDRHIREHRAEIEAVRNSGARLVVFSGAEAGSTWEQLEILMRQWRKIEGLLGRTGPFIAMATLTTLNDLPIR